MARTTGPIIIMGTITTANAVIVHNQPFSLGIPAATLGAAVVFAGLEKIDADVAVALAYTALIAVLLTRVNPKVPSPVESFNSWLEGK